MNLFKLFKEIWKDNRGIAAMAIPAAISLGSTILGATAGKNKKEVYDPLSAERSAYTGYLSGKMGTSTEYADNPAFNLDQPDVEKTAESTILGKLGSLPQSEDYKSKVEAAKTQAISREKESALKQQQDEQAMYNRLGLVSSSPWLGRAGELGNESLMRQGDISSEYDMYGLDYNLKADQLADEIAQGWTGAATGLGSQQRGYQQYSQGMSADDISRKTAEEQAYAQMMGSLLGQNPAEVTETPNIWSNLAQAGQDIGGMMGQSAVLGNKTSKVKKVGGG
jgi:hypothetical protein